MTNEEFAHIQHVVLGISGRELARILKVSPSSVSRWAIDQPIPGPVAGMMKQLSAEKLKKLKLPMTLEELVGLSRLAESKGTTVEALITESLKELLRQNAPPPMLKVAEADDVGGGGLADGD